MTLQVRWVPDAVEDMQGGHTWYEEREFIDGIPAMTVAAAIRATKGRILRGRLTDAARQAEARGLISEAALDDLIEDLTDQAARTPASRTSPPSPPDSSG